MTEEFTHHFKNTTSDKIITIIKKGDWQDILHGICNIKDNSVFLNYSYFKYFGTKETYAIVLNYILHTWIVVELILKIVQVNFLSI